MTVRREATTSAAQDNNDDDDDDDDGNQRWETTTKNARAEVSFAAKEEAEGESSRPHAAAVVVAAAGGREGACSSTHRIRQLRPQNSPHLPSTPPLSDRNCANGLGGVGDAQRNRKVARHLSAGPSAGRTGLEERQSRGYCYGFHDDPRIRPLIVNHYPTPIIWGTTVCTEHSW